MQREIKGRAREQGKWKAELGRTELDLYLSSVNT
jgi:hypothetical protein